MEKLVLNERELLLQSALGLIGMTIPQKYIIRMVMLEELAKDKGLGNISISDGVDIEKCAEREYQHRCNVCNTDESDPQDKHDK